MPREEEPKESAEDAAWAAIVANYGERAVLDDQDTVPGGSHPEPEVADGAEPIPGDTIDEADGADEPESAYLEDEERYIPPPPPPVPRPPLDRLIAWIGVFGSPAALLVCMIAGIQIPIWLGWAMVIGFIGGFGYLLARSPGTPRDPWDDGSRV